MTANTDAAPAPRGGASIAKLLVGTDFTPVSDHALRYAIDLAAQLGASVDVLHAFALPSFNLPIEGALISTPHAAADHSNRAQQQLDQQLARCPAGAVAVRGHLRAGAAPEELLRFAAETSADLIVVGTHARRGPAHVLLGSVAERVVRSSPLPVLTVTPSAA
jgi:nucleotide-binding universal stress UspA family protein